MSEWIILHIIEGGPVHVRASSVTAFAQLGSEEGEGSAVYVNNVAVAPPMIVAETVDEIRTLLGIRV